jgi:mono/diheme cytochrome c family protein
MDVMDPRAAICATADAAGLGAAPPFDLIQQIFDDNCVSCHSPGADVDLSPGVAWTNLVGRPAPSPEACGGTLVVPGDAEASYLYQKLSLAQPCSGARMPRTEFASDPLPDCVTALVRNWIATGAPGPTAQ